METERVKIEIIGFAAHPCGPFPCDGDRTCEMDDCHPEGTLQDACRALEARLEDLYGDRVQMECTFLDDGVPDRVKLLIEEHHPPLPIILINGRITPIGRISMPLIRREVDKYLK